MIKLVGMTLSRLAIGNKIFMNFNPNLQHRGVIEAKESESLEVEGIAQFHASGLDISHHPEVIYKIPDFNMP